MTVIEQLKKCLRLLKRGRGRSSSVLDMVPEISPQPLINSKIKITLKQKRPEEEKEFEISKKSKRSKR